MNVRLLLALFLGGVLLLGCTQPAPAEQSPEPADEPAPEPSLPPEEAPVLGEGEQAITEEEIPLPPE